MKKNKKNEIKVGIVSIVGILLFFSVLYLTKTFTFGDNKVSILFEFDNALGMDISAPVFINGVKRGSVNKIWLKEGKVLVNALLENIDDLQEDCTAEIQILELTGGKKIEITSGTSLNKFNPQNTIIGKESFDLGSAISKFGDITSDLRTIVSKVDTLISVSISTLKDTNITHIVNNTAEATASLNNLINDKRIEKMISNLANVSNDLHHLVNDNKDGINRIANNLDTSAAELTKMLNEVQITITDTRTTISKINDFMDDIKKSDGAVGRLIYDTTLAKKMEGLFDSIDSLAVHIKKHGINANVRLGGRP